MLELFNGVNATSGSDIPEAGDTLIAGTSTLGYYGFNRDIISGTSLASSIGLTAGTAINSNEGWLKYSYQGKVCYIAKNRFVTTSRGPMSIALVLCTVPMTTAPFRLPLAIAPKTHE